MLDRVFAGFCMFLWVFVRFWGRLKQDSLNYSFNEWKFNFGIQHDILSTFMLWGRSQCTLRPHLCNDAQPIQAPGWTSRPPTPPKRWKEHSETTGFGTPPWLLPRLLAAPEVSRRHTRKGAPRTLQRLSPARSSFATDSPPTYKFRVYPYII